MTDSLHFVEIDWQASSAAGADDGSMSLWLDGILQQTLSGIDNDEQAVDEVRLGPQEGVDDNTRGTYFFDAFESRRQNGIGSAGIQADFSAGPTSGDIPLQVFFTDDSIPAGAAGQWLWEFGDGGNSLLQNPVYTYTVAGIYTVTLTVTDTATSESDTISKANFINVNEPMTSDLVTTTITYEYDSLYRLMGATYADEISATYKYVYDSVGNMTFITETVGTETTRVQRSFDAANRLTNSFDYDLGTTTYTYDDAGNLTEIRPPGASLSGTVRYGYDQRNLLITSTQYVSGTGWVNQAEYVYDGAGDRVQQVDYTGAQPITTTYTNDILGLTQVLVAGDGTDQVINLFGLDLISQDSGSEVRTLLVDGLGSVRVEMVDNSVETVTTYSPYGKLLEQKGVSGTTYGFTGEQYDGATGLLYLRARYYNPYLYRMLTPDTIVPNYSNPQSLNRHSYVFGNPTNLSDPSGHDPWLCEDATCQSDYYGFDFNPRDLTSWLYREMMTNVNDSRLRQVRSANRAADTALIAGTTVAVGGTCTAILPIVIAGLVVDEGAVGVYGLAFLQYYTLVGDHQTWDFKHRIEERLGPGITLCSGSDCKSNIEYSVPGNIHFGYVSREAGYHDIVTHIGAGAAEIFDPSHQPFTLDYDYDPTGKFRVYLDRNGVGLHINFGDDQKDHDAVQFGVYLYGKYGRYFTLAQFKRELGTFMGRFERATPDDNRVAPYFASKWPYPVGYFDPTK